MSVDRTLIIKGPAVLTYDAASIFSTDDIAVRWITDYFDVNSSAFGRLKRRVQARRIEIELTPAMWTDLAKLFPYATKNIGDAIFGATDKALVITPRNGAPITFDNAAITRLPGITLSANKAILRPMTFTCLCANSASPATAANWFSFGVVGTDVALTGFDLTKVYNDLYSLAFNTVTYRSEEGFTLEFNLSLDPDLVDGDGIVNYRIRELEATLRFTPALKTEAEYATLLGWDGKGIGSDPTAANAVISGTAVGSPVVTLTNAMVAEGGVRYGAANRLGEVQLQSIRTISANVLSALWSFSSVSS